MKMWNKRMNDVCNCWVQLTPMPSDESDVAFQRVDLVKNVMRSTYCKIRSIAKTLWNLSDYRLWTSSVAAICIFCQLNPKTSTLMMTISYRTFLITCALDIELLFFQVMPPTCFLLQSFSISWKLVANVCRFVGSAFECFCSDASRFTKISVGPCSYCCFFRTTFDWTDSKFSVLFKNFS